MSATTIDQALEAETDEAEGGVGPALTRVVSRVLLPAMLVVVLLFVLAYSVFPTRSWLDQRQVINERSAELSEFQSENAALQAQVTLLGSEAEIERLAREDHGLVRRGEEAYAVLPAAPPPVILPQGWPFTELARTLEP